MSKKLQKAIHNILVKDFSKAMGFDKETGILPNSKKRFTGIHLWDSDIASRHQRF